MSAVHEPTPGISPVNWKEGLDYLQNNRDRKKIQQNHLRVGWSVARTTQGWLYYLDHSRCCTSWHHPVITRAFSSDWKDVLTAGPLDEHRNLLLTSTLHQKVTKDSWTHTIGYINDAMRHRSQHEQIVQKKYRSLSDLLRGGRLTRRIESQLLPSRWTIWNDPDFDYPVFINPCNRIVQRQHPATHRIWESEKTPACSIDGSGTSVVCKVSSFRDLCLSCKTYGKLEITVRKTHALLAECYEQIMHVPGYELRKELVVSFRDSVNKELYSGTRKWFCLTFCEMAEPSHGLFQQAKGNGTGLELFSGPSVGSRSDHLKRFRFLGRFIAMGLYHGKSVDLEVGPTLMFCRRLLRRENNAYAENSVYLKNTKSTELGSDSTRPNQHEPEKKWGAAVVSFFKRAKDRFNYGFDSNKAKNKDPENAEIKVTLNHDCSKMLEERWQAVIDGLNEVIPHQWLRYFNQYDLQLLLCGIRNIDVGRWQRHTEYENCGPTNKQIVWFWQFVQALDNERCSRLLQFTVGICTFHAEGTFPLPKFRIEIAEFGAKSSFSDNPRRVLYLAPYKTYHLLVEDLTELIKEKEAVIYK